MELMLQFGYGMMEHTRILLRSWGGGTVILSPRDQEPDQLGRFAAELLRGPGNRLLLDPQFYIPHADHNRLTSHAFWPSDFDSGVFWQGRGLADMLRRLGDLNQALGTNAVILPGLLAASVDDAWLSVQASILGEARRLIPERLLFATVALSADALRTTDQVQELLEASEEWNVDGVYLVTEHPAEAYLAADPAWLANKLHLVAHQRLRGRQVICGYCTHQMLVAACAGANAVASGTWMNVRSFPPEKFDSSLEDEIRQRATWYYCPQALSEYKLVYLDIAQRTGHLLGMRAPQELGSTYADVLFAGPQPSASDFDERAAFRHYLQCFHAQAAAARQDTFDATVQQHRTLLDGAERMLRALRAGGVYGQMREFTDSVDANRAALAVLDNTRGPVLRRNWAAL